MQNNKPITPALTYFFKRMEKRSAEIEKVLLEEESKNEEVPFEEVENFFRSIMTQNIFIHTVGMNGKHESTILSKAIFSMNKVVRVYYSTSFDEDMGGFMRIRQDQPTQSIIVERMHGYRPQPELIYSSKDQCHVIRFMIRWLMRRIDWDKTKLNNLDMYKRVLDHLQKELEAKIAESARLAEEAEIQKALEKHTQNRRRKIHS